MNYSFDTQHSSEFGGGAVLDRDAFSALEELAGDDDPDLVAEIIGLFLEDSVERMSQVEAAIGELNADVIGAAAHALKSSSANLGACSFSSACAELEAAARGADSELESIARRVLGMYAEVRRVLSEG